MHCMLVVRKRAEWQIQKYLCWGKSLLRNFGSYYILAHVHSRMTLYTASYVKWLMQPLDQPLPVQSSYHCMHCMTACIHTLVTISSIAADQCTFKWDFHWLDTSITSYIIETTWNWVQDTKYVSPTYVVLVEAAELYSWEEREIEDIAAKTWITGIVLLDYT